MQRRRKEHRDVFRMIAECDLAIEVLDARFPLLTRSKKMEDFARSKDKKLLFVINKCDLVPRRVAKGWRHHLTKEEPTVYISATQRLGTSRLRKRIGSMLGSVPGDRLVCIFGTPNTGKSSLINNLAGRHALGTSSLAGFTRHLKLVRISPKVMMVDTAGVSPVDDLPISIKVFLGSLPVEKIDDPLSAFNDVLERIRSNYINGFEEFYQVNLQKEVTSEEILEEIAVKRGRILKGGVPDVEETARIVIRELQSGRFQYWELPPHLKGDIEVEDRS